MTNTVGKVTYWSKMKLNKKFVCVTIIRSSVDAY